MFLDKSPLKLPFKSLNTSSIYQERSDGLPTCHWQFRLVAVEACLLGMAIALLNSEELLSALETVHDGEPVVLSWWGRSSQAPPLPEDVDRQGEQ